MSKVKKILGNWVVVNLFIAIVLIALIFIGVNVGLKVFTEHNKTVKVPDMLGCSYLEAMALCQENELQLIVADSVFVNRFRPGAVYSQNPKAGSEVKTGRKIYLTMNSSKKRQVSMPSLVGLSVRQAKVELTARNLLLGKLIYKEDIATNNVMAQMIGGRRVPEGEKLDVGTTVDLVVGLNYDDPYTQIPSFIELPYHKAVNSVQDSYLNIDRLYFDDTVKSYSDSLAAFVYRQHPESSDNKVLMGRGVSLYLTLDREKLPKPASADSLTLLNP
ncbi:MAG: PASTA domain-containing protein [Candidatus Cryptobacteroides sp.]